MELTRRKAVVVSLRHNPGHYSHLVGMGKSLVDLGFEVEYLLDSPYAQVPELSAVAPVLYSSAESLKREHTHAIFVNISLQNWRVAAALKQRGARILYIYHEPWRYSLDYFVGEGLKRWLSSALAHQVSKAMLKHSDVVILPSEYALQTYAKGDVRYNCNAHSIPLMYPDEVNGSFAVPPARKYFSYIGNICGAHGFDEYLGFMRHAFARGLGLDFLIASKRPLPPDVLRDACIRNHLHRIHIACGRPLTIPEINRYYAESFCVWNLYRRSTQSGVLVKAFMFGTPVIAGRGGSFPEFVRDGFNGRFASVGDYPAIEAAALDIRERLHEYSANCRKTFLETFYYRASLRKLERLLSQLTLYQRVEGNGSTTHSFCTKSLEKPQRNSL